ncbi:FAD-binding oxidoreductase [Williamsia herbipolensis]|uniref:FAD-binding oxidoreductase n=1 Tax=Williamsia herbipolensis TaxID=1603258 RepID=UPI0005F79956|nr:FAD-binding oxidoreductase [Williamsia herbipolensis]
MTATFADALPGKIDTRAAVLDGFTRDETGRGGRPPRAVVHAHTLDDVVECVRWCSATRTPVITVGAGTSLEGHLLARGDEVMLDLSAMTAITRVSPFDFTAVVEPGVTRTQLDAALTPHGLHFPVDPGADATLGGMAATNASGTTSVRYGAMRPNIAALQVVFADGTVHRLGRPVAKTSSGYDLKDLLIGSAGTLGVITGLTVRCHPVPDAMASLRLQFDSISDAVSAAVAMLSSAVAVTRLELVDAASIAAINRYRQTRYPERPTLFVDAAGPTRAVLDDVTALVAELASECGCTGIDIARTATEQTALWENRHHLFFAIKAAHPGHRFLVTDTAVPLSEIAGAVDAAHRCAAQLGVGITVAGHIGDGNVHVVIPYSGETYCRARAFSDRMVEYALSVGGTASGEHGIGLSKKRYLAAEHGGAVDVMRAVKSALDPLGILNPGRIFNL